MRSSLDILADSDMSAVMGESREMMALGFAG